MTRAIPDLRRLRGFVPAVPKPFRDGRIDEDAAREVETVVQTGVDGRGDRDEREHPRRQHGYAAVLDEIEIRRAC